MESENTDSCSSQNRALVSNRIRKTMFIRKLRSGIKAYDFDESPENYFVAFQLQVQYNQKRQKDREIKRAYFSGRDTERTAYVRKI